MNFFQNQYEHLIYAAFTLILSSQLVQSYGYHKKNLKLTFFLRTQQQLATLSFDMKRLQLPLLLFLLSSLSSYSSPLWTENFESLQETNPAPSPLISKSGITWTASPAAKNAHRIYKSPNFDMSTMWVSNQVKTTLTSSGTAVTPATRYTFTFFSALDYRHLGGSGSLMAEILVGPSVQTGKVVASENYKITGKVGDTLNKESAMHQISTSIAENKPNHKIFIRFTVNTPTQQYWTCLDDISLAATSAKNSPSQAQNKPVTQAETTQKTSPVDGTLISIGGISVRLK